MSLTGPFGYIDTSGKVAIDSPCAAARPVSEGLAGAAQGGRWGFMDKTGKLVIPPTFEDVGSFSEGLAGAKSGGKWGYIDKAGVFVVQPQYVDSLDGEQSSFRFSEGLAEVRVESGLIGFVDKSGKLAIPAEFGIDSFRFDNGLIGGFHNGLAAVGKVGSSEQMGYIDKRGKFVIPPKEGTAYSFRYGRVAMFQPYNNTMHYIDTAGKVLYQGTLEDSGPST